MRNHLAIILTFLFFAAACTPSANPAQTQNAATPEAVGITATNSTTQISPTATLQPVVEPTPTTTPRSTLYDRENYRKFAVIRSSYPGFEDWRAERTYSTISYTFSPDGRKMAISACWGSISNVWSCESAKSGFLVVIDADNGDLLNEIPMEDAWPGPAAFSPDGNTLMFSTNKRKVRLWDLATNTVQSTFLNAPAAGSAQYPDVAIAPDGSSFAAATRDMLYVWNSSGGILLQVPAYNIRANAGLAYSADGSRLSVFSANRAGVDVYNTADWTLIRSLNLSEILDADMTPDGRLLAAFTDQRSSVGVWEIDTGKQIAEFDPGLHLLSIKFNPAGDLLMISGYSNLDNQDDYSKYGAIYETQTWSKLDDFYSFIGEGEFTFNIDGSRMAIFGSFANTIWELPDAQLQAGFEVVQQFQQALSTGDFDSAALLFDATSGAMDYLADQGFDANDVTGSLEGLCAAQLIFCSPVKELVLMGYDWEDMVYMVRLEGPSGEVFTSPKGATIIYMYLLVGVDGQPRLIFPAMD